MNEPVNNPKNNLPRHGACTLELKGGTGRIISQCSCVGFTEIYKVDMTFQIQSPEDLDPEEIDPNMSWVVTPMPGVGCGNEIVARLMVQSEEFIKIAIRDEKSKNKIMHFMRQCKELLLICNSISQEMSSEVQKVIKSIKCGEIQYDTRNRVYNPFPYVTGLDDKCIRFLSNAKNFLQSLAEVFNIFYDTDCHGPHFHKIRDILLKKFGEQNTLYKLVNENEGTIKHIVSLRNAQEHPEDEKLTIKNFTVAPGNKIKPPEWELRGSSKQDIGEEMAAITQFLLEFAEAFLICCVFSSGKLAVPYILKEVPESERNENCPIRYEPQIDINTFLRNQKA